MNTIKDSLIASGFDPSMADIYLALAEAGETTVGKLIEKTTLSRAGTYDALNYLLAQGFVEYRKEGRNAYYKLTHPEKLRDLLAERKREVKTLEDELGNTIKTVTGMYNLSQSMPGVRFFEGKEKIIEAYEQLLALNEPIDSIEDKGEMATFIPDYFPTFIQKRVEKKIFNRVVVPTTNQINKTSEKEMRETRTISVDEFPFSMDIKIAGNIVLLTTLKKEQAIAVWIDHPLIAENFKLIFKFFWHHAAKRSGEVSADKTGGDASSVSTVFNT